MLGNLGLVEILIILAVAALVFGAKRLPELGKGLGQGINNFKNALRGRDDESKTPKKDDDQAKG